MNIKAREWLLVLAVVVMFTAIMGHKCEAAEPERWAGTPVFYTDYTPKAVECVYDQKAFQGSCLIKGYPEEGIVGITTTDPEVPATSQAMRLYTEVTCVMGVCETQYGERAGRVLDGTTQYWTIPVGYYLNEDASGIHAYKHGNGPQQRVFPIRGIELIDGDKLPDGHYLPEAGERLSFNVSCNDAGDCYYMGKEINYVQLNQYVPRRLTMHCDERFCYNPEQTIAGLNPRTNS